VKINLKLIKNVRKTKTSFWISQKTLEVDDIIIYLTKDGTGIEHELIELTLLIATVKVYPDIINYNWDICKSLFHQLTELALE